MRRIMVIILEGVLREISVQVGTAMPGRMMDYCFPFDRDKLPLVNEEIGYREWS